MTSGLTIQPPCVFKICSCKKMKQVWHQSRVSVLNLCLHRDWRVFLSDDATVVTLSKVLKKIVLISFRLYMLNQCKTIKQKLYRYSWSELQSRVRQRITLRKTNNSECWPSRSGLVVLAACDTDGRGFQIQPEPQVSRKACWPLFSQQVSYQRWILGSDPWQSTQGIHPGFETQGRYHQKSKNRGISSPTKRTFFFQKLKKTRAYFLKVMQHTFQK